LKKGKKKKKGRTSDRVMLISEKGVKKTAKSSLGENGSKDGRHAEELTPPPERKKKNVLRISG